MKVHSSAIILRRRTFTDICIMNPSLLAAHCTVPRRLGSIPPSFGNLLRLDRVVLDCNRLRRLPETLGRMKCRWFNVSNNKLVSDYIVCVLTFCSNTSSIQSFLFAHTAGCASFIDIVRRVGFERLRLAPTFASTCFYSSVCESLGRRACPTA